MEERRFEFSEKRLAAIEPTSKRQYFYDTASDLEFVLTPAGNRSYYAYHWNRAKGRPDRAIVGRFGEVSLHKARRECEKKMAQFTLGADPNAEKRALRMEMTLQELFDLCLEQDYKPHIRSWPEYQNIFRRYLLPWKNRPISEVTREQIQTLHARIGRENGHYSANRALQLLSSLFSKAITRGWKHPHPCKGIKKFREQSRRRFLQADELPRFFEAVKEQDPLIRDYVLLSLLTGARRSNVLSMRWNELNLQRAEWEIPASKSKNGESLVVPLAPQAIAILKERAGNGSEFVFPSDSRTGHLLDPKKGWAAILKRAKISELRLHDLRRSLGSFQAAAGASLSIIGRSLGHQSLQATAIYARLDLDPVRASVENAVDSIWKLGKQPKAKVIPFRKRRAA